MGAHATQSQGTDTHGRWPLAAALLAPPSWAAALARRRRGGWVATFAFPILLTHQAEEWVRPGGFLPFCNERLLGAASPTWPLTERDGFHVNVTIGWSSALAAAALRHRTAVPAAFVLWIEGGNALMHAGMALRERRYNPGLVTATLLMGAHAAAGAVRLRRSGGLSARGARLAAAAGIGFTAGLPLAMRLRMRLASGAGDQRRGSRPVSAR